MVGISEGDQFRLLLNKVRCLDPVCAGLQLPDSSFRIGSVLIRNPRRPCDWGRIVLPQTVIKPITNVPRTIAHAWLEIFGNFVLFVSN